MVTHFITKKLSSMKAWEQVSANDESWIYRTLNSSWYIDHGVKIECFDLDGRIEVMNVMTASDFHEPVTDEQLHLFTNVGWEAGCYKVNVDSLDKRIKVLERLSELSKDDEELYESETIDERLAKMLEKKQKYARKLEKILKTL
jgi:hypothetical protein